MRHSSEAAYLCYCDLQVEYCWRYSIFNRDITVMVGVRTYDVSLYGRLDTNT
jgi:hypothetical protein